jgi:hypothetical protein
MVEYTMGGEHGGNNDNNMTLQDVVDVGNTEQPMMGGEQGVTITTTTCHKHPFKQMSGTRKRAGR